MSASNNSWYNRNGQRDFPLTRASDLSSDAGHRLPQDILVDAQVTLPENLGRTVKLSGASISSAAVSLAFEAVSDVDPAITSPVGQVYVSADQFVAGVPVPLSTVDPAIVGWVVFGDGLLNGLEYSGRFSRRDQAHLMASTCHYYPLPVLNSVGRPGYRRTFDDVVTLGGSGLVLTPDRRVLEDGRVVTYLRVGLPRTTTLDLDGQEVSTLQSFLGNCDRRPESGTCGDPQPIERINNVAPDENGLITVEFAGCAEIQQFESDNAIVVDCGIGLASACAPTSLPDRAGNIESPYVVACRTFAAEREPGRLSIDVEEHFNISIEDYLSRLRPASVGGPSTVPVIENRRLVLNMLGLSPSAIARELVNLSQLTLTNPANDDDAFETLNGSFEARTGQTDNTPASSGIWYTRYQDHYLKPGLYRNGPRTAAVTQTSTRVLPITAETSGQFGIVDGSNDLPPEVVEQQRRALVIGRPSRRRVAGLVLCYTPQGHMIAEFDADVRTLSLRYAIGNQFKYYRTMFSIDVASQGDDRDLDRFSISATIRSEYQLRNTAQGRQLWESAPRVSVGLTTGQAAETLNYSPDVEQAIESMAVPLPVTFDGSQFGVFSQDSTVAFRGLNLFGVSSNSRR